MRIIMPVLVGRTCPFRAVDHAMARMNGMVALELVHLTASARSFLNRRVFIALGVPIASVELEPVASAGELRLVLVLLLLLEAALSTLCSARNLVAVERRQF